MPQQMQMMQALGQMMLNCMQNPGAAPAGPRRADTSNLLPGFQMFDPDSQQSAQSHASQSPESADRAEGRQLQQRMSRGPAEAEPTATQYAAHTGDAVLSESGDEEDAADAAVVEGARQSKPRAMKKARGKAKGKAKAKAKAKASAPAPKVKAKAQAKAKSKAKIGTLPKNLLNFTTLVTAKDAKASVSRGAFTSRAYEQAKKRCLNAGVSAPQACEVGKLAYAKAAAVYDKACPS